MQTIDVVKKFNNLPTDHPAVPTQAIMGMIGEIGEIIDILKKQEFQNHPYDDVKLQKEFADLAYYKALWDASSKNLDYTIANLNLFLVLVDLLRKVLSSYLYDDDSMLDDYYKATLKTAGYTEEELTRVLNDKLSARYSGGEFNANESINRND